MTIEIGTCMDAYNALQKTPSLNAVSNVSVYGDCSIMNPTFLLDFNVRYLHCNYLHAFDRYYWITDIILMPGHRCRIICDEDVLYTHKNEILSLYAYPNRSESNRDQNVVDESIIAKVKNNIAVKRFSLNPFGAGNESYLLTVIGGGYRT